jgi:hypothetical protein
MKPKIDQPKGAIQITINGIQIAARKGATILDASREASIFVPTLCWDERLVFLIAYLESCPILGIPACGMFAKTTIFDLILPRVLAGERVARSELAELGHGGLCMKCDVCRYPVCPFGK